MNIFWGMKILWISFGVITKHQQVNPKNGPGLRMYENIRVPPPPLLTQDFLGPWMPVSGISDGWGLL